MRGRGSQQSGAAGRGRGTSKPPTTTTTTSASTSTTTTTTTVARLQSVPPKANRSSHKGEKVGRDRIRMIIGYFIWKEWSREMGKLLEVIILAAPVAGCFIEMLVQI